MCSWHLSWMLFSGYKYLDPTLESDWSVPNYRGFSHDLSKWRQRCQKAELRKILTILWDISTENTLSSLGDFNVYDFITKTCYFFYNRKMFKAHIEAFYCLPHGLETFPRGDQSVEVSLIRSLNYVTLLFILLKIHLRKWSFVIMRDNSSILTYY